MRWFLVACLAMVPSVARADVDLHTAETRSLAQLFAVAVRGAPALETAALVVAQARAQYLDAQAPHDLIVRATADYNQTSGAPALTGANEVTSAGYELSLRKLLPTNGTLELSGTTRETRTDAGKASELATSSIRLLLVQPLLKDIGSDAANRARDTARLHVRAATARRAALAGSFAHELVASYWQLALTWRQLEVQRTSFELARKQLAFIESGIRTGKFTPSDLLPVQQAVATRRQAIRGSELEIIERSIALRRMVGLEIAIDGLAVRPIDLPTPAPIGLELGELVRRALAANDEVAAAVEEQRLANAAVAGSRRAAWPRADLRLEAGLIGTDTAVQRSLGQISEGYVVGASLNVELPIGNHAGSALVAADRAVAVDRAFQLRRTRDDVVARVARAVYAARSHLAGSQDGARAIELAQANVDAENKKFELGRSSSAEIIRRQDELEAVRLREAAERARYQIALAALDHATGMLLAKYGIEVVDRWFDREGAR